MATLKISDLSVGDWVRYDGKEYQVQCVDVMSEMVTLFGYCEQREESAGNLRSIPITAEILEKNGFVKKNYDNGKMWDWWCDNVLVRKFADEDIYRFIVAFDSKHYTTMMVVGKHIHQLQHALRLAEVDKEINL